MIFIQCISIIKLQSSRSGVVKEYIEPYVRAATAGTYPPFLNSGTVKATLSNSSFFPNFKVPSFVLNSTFTISPGPNAIPNSSPVVFEACLSFPVENRA